MDLAFTIIIILITIITTIYKHVHNKPRTYYSIRSHTGRFKTLVTNKQAIRTLSNKPMIINYYKTK